MQVCECKRRCQGIVTLVNNSLNAEVKHITTNDENDIQLIKLWKNGQQFSLYNLYSPPNTACSAHLDEINFQKTIIAGDTNAHSPVWGYADTNASGDYIEDIVNSTNLILLQNKDSPPTFLGNIFSRGCTFLIRSEVQDKDSSRITLKKTCSTREPLLVWTDSISHNLLLFLFQSWSMICRKMRPSAVRK